MNITLTADFKPTKKNKFFSLLLLILFSIGLCLVPATSASDKINIEGLQYGQFTFTLQTEPTGYEDAFQFIRFKEKIKKNLLWSGLYQFVSEIEQSDIIITLNYVANKRVSAFIDSKWGSRFLVREKSLLSNEPQQIDEVISQITYHLTGETNHLGNAIIYVEKGDFPGYRLILTDPFGNARNVLIDDGNLNILPRWKPDSSSVLFTSLGKDGSHIKQYDFLNNQVETFLSSEHKFSGGTWGKNGELIITITKNGNSDLYKINHQGKILEQLTNRSSTESNPRWSPNGKRLVFISNRSGSIQIYQKDMIKGTVSRMTYEGGTNVEPNWSANGGYIVFAGMRNGLYQICLMDKEGEYLQQVTNGADSSEQPVWAPSGRQILFISKRGTDYKLYIMNADGTGKRRVTKSGRGISEFNPTWTANFDWQQLLNN